MLKQTDVNNHDFAFTFKCVNVHYNKPDHSNVCTAKKTIFLLQNVQLTAKAIFKFKDFESVILNSVDSGA